ncbi:MAG: hypothetical protein AVDCRST_MAG73-2026 [uncultured Thermomicrobiales bacterium]|uniref:Uncharacterized protein n=1 Tax=uncultured Thermomicrobiales bacterium TaxID=1645740 RepID=A0A6J4U691_9BACT|nr:MAG: hypothetical protein AVDCRST_MAG73-2026 [uncultured Thermomicrobiales bacterium]
MAVVFSASRAAPGRRRPGVRSMASLPPRRHRRPRQRFPPVRRPCYDPAPRRGRSGIPRRTPRE